MDAPHFPNSFTIDILTYFSSTNWSTNVVDNPVVLRGIAHSTLTFTRSLDIPLVLDGFVVVTFFLQPTIYNNLLINLFPYAI